MRYIFVVDTDKYAGNFERELVAYMTGQIGDCEVGEEEAKLFAREEGEELVTEMEDLVRQESDGNCFRPASVFPTPGWFNTGMGNAHRDDEDPALVLETYKKSTIKYEQGYLDMYGRYLDEVRAGKKIGDWTEEALLKVIKEFDEKIEGIRNQSTFNHYSAYMSAGVYLNKKPTQEQIELFKRRAEAYALAHNLNIESYRLVQQKTVEESEYV